MFGGECLKTGYPDEEISRNSGSLKGGGYSRGAKWGN